MLADLVETLQIALLALAVGCGVPALIYLAFKGNIRFSKENFTATKEDENLIPVKIEPPKPDANRDIPELSKVDWEKVYTDLPVKGYIYVPKPVLRQVIRELQEEERRRREAFERLVEEEKAKEASAKSAKPKPQVRRIPP